MLSKVADVVGAVAVNITSTHPRSLYSKLFRIFIIINYKTLIRRLIALLYKQSQIQCQQNEITNSKISEIPMCTFDVSSPTLTRENASTTTRLVTLRSTTNR